MSRTGYPRVQACFVAGSVVANPSHRQHCLGAHAHAARWNWTANIASSHPNQGLCQIDRLKQYGVSREQIDTVIEIARHIRDEAAQKMDAKFDEAYAACMKPADPFAQIAVVELSLIHI